MNLMHGDFSTAPVPITLANIKNGDRVRFRVGRAGADNVVWEDWRVGPMYVQRRERPFPRRLLHRVNRRALASHEVGAIVIITPESAPQTAEFSIDDLCEVDETVFCCEDYYLQLDIPKLDTPQTPQTPVDDWKDGIHRAPSGETYFYTRERRFVLRITDDANGLPHPVWVFESMRRPTT